MIWRKLPYWAKGVIGVFLVFLVLAIIAFPSAASTPGGNLAGIIIPLIGLPLTIIDLLGQETSFLIRSTYYWAILPFAIAFWFIVGAFIGWTYGKIKAYSNINPLSKT